jgi:excisionase family DNA binding protein
MPPERVSLTIPQYAQRHGVTPRTVRRWIKAGRVPAIRHSRQTVRIELLERPVLCQRCQREVAQ